MSINSYLRNLASSLVLSSEEKAGIETSLETLKKHLSCFSFEEEIVNEMVFGSYTRETILPRKYDDNSDIDYLVLFNHSVLRDYKPQTYLNWLRQFVQRCYKSSEIYQSSPTIVLELQHIKFELTPAWYSYCNGYYIPNDQSQWQITQIREDDQTLMDCNRNNGYVIKPIIRLIKLWNVSNNSRRFKSYLIEKQIAKTSFYYCVSYTDYLLHAMHALESIFYDDWNIIDKTISSIQNAIEKESLGRTTEAENTIKRLFPEA